MDEHSFRRLISGQTHGISAACLRAALASAEVLSSTVIRLRNRMFDAGLRPAARVRVPVISIGNLTTGGTGKTPVVAAVVQMLQGMGRIPAIVSRGYRADASGANDEKRLLERTCPGVPHEQHSDRIRAARTVLRDSAVDAIVMDDGFQHRRLHRDLDVVLIDATCPFGYGHVLPRGLLREPVHGLRRAGVVLITRSDLASESELQQLEAVVRRAAGTPEPAVCRTVFMPVGLIDAQGRRQALETLQSRSVFLVCGIGNPDAFLATASAAGAVVVGHRAFADHHHYSAADVRSVAAAAQQAGASTMLVTAKDLVKLPPSAAGFLALEIALRFVSSTDAGHFEQQLRNAVSDPTASPSPP